MRIAVSPKAMLPYAITKWYGKRQGMFTISFHAVLRAVTSQKGERTLAVIWLYPAGKARETAVGPLPWSLNFPSKIVPLTRNFSSYLYFMYVLLPACVRPSAEIHVALSPAHVHPTYNSQVH